MNPLKKYVKKERNIMNINDLTSILSQEKPSELLKENEEYLFSLIPSLKTCKGFNQNNDWHIYDVYEHSLHVVDGVPNILALRLAALFHDIGKPYTYTEDENKIGHFYHHWVKSNEIFLSFANQYKLEENLKKTVSKLIFYHDINFENIDKFTHLKITNSLSKEEIKYLFILKKSDLLAQAPQYHKIAEEYHQQEKKLLLSDKN